MKKLRLAGIVNYDQANAFLEEHYLAEHNRRYAHPAAAPADYHRRRPTARQLDEVFWLEEERVVSEDWVVRYHNRLLQLQPQSRHWAPAKSRVLVRENEAGELTFIIANQRWRFREWRASPARGEGRGAALPPRPHPRDYAAVFLRPPIIPGDKAFNKETQPTFLAQHETHQGTFLLWRKRGHFYCGMTSGSSRLDKTT